MTRGGLVVGLCALLLGRAASASTAPAVEGPAPPPGPKASSPQPGPKASSSQPGPKASPTAEGPAPPPAGKPTAEGPAPLPEAIGARATSERPWLREQPANDGEANRGDLGLTRQRDGSRLYVDPGKRFTAAVNADGSVRFGNRWGRDQHGQRMRGSGAALRTFGPTGIGGSGMAMTGPTEWLLALSGQESDAAAKAEFLNRTRDLRIQLAVAFTRQLLDMRLGQLGHELMGLWSDDSRTLVTRRAIVFQRWDECDERLVEGLPTGADLPAEAISAIDDARLAAADRARRTIEGFVRRQMPRGTPRGYAPAELAELNRRRVSAETFAPYETRRVRATPSPVPTDMSSGAALP